jgi:nucleoid DNA-binding protein
MIPKKASKLYTQLAEEMQVDEMLVETLITSYYKEIRSCISELKYPRLDIEGLGHFVVKAKIVEEKIPKIQKSLEDHDTSTFNAYFNKKGKEQKLGQLIEIQKLILIEEQRKETFKLKKDEYIKTDLEGKKKDS